ncbi:MAG: DUF3795 domain-containing protein [Prevotellaceae bacterium]|jgi:hypothetical protein|nr:DUF3795 domain-containing protein [Prevotellaceae bacterium]
MYTQNFSVCGVDCYICDSFEDGCRNCDAAKECDFLLRHRNVGTTACPIYNCIIGKGFESCGQCELLPCNLWSEFKYSGWTEQEHKQSIIDRVELLRKMYGR